MRHLAVSLALGLLVVACGSAPPAEPVQLLIGTPFGPGAGGDKGCLTNHADGLLVVDPKYGAAIIDHDVGATVPTPVMWRPGFTGVRVGSEVEILDPSGAVVAITGRSYVIDGGYVEGGFWACDRVTPR